MDISQGKELHNDKGLILPENIAILNIYFANNRSTEYIRQKLKEVQEEIDIHIYIYAGYFKIFCFSTIRPSRQRISKDIFGINFQIIFQKIEAEGTLPNSIKKKKS